MVTILRHPEGFVRITKLDDGRLQIACDSPRGSGFPPNTCVTKYPLDLVEKILLIKGPAYLCEEITREEAPQSHLAASLEFGIFGYLAPENLSGKRILEFGCGCGAFTILLARAAPEAEIVGLDLFADHVELARARISHYGLRQIHLLISPGPTELPADLGSFDHIILNAVWEHLLPDERAALLPQIWSSLRPGGILHITETPERYFPIELHTTGLPLINYLPPRLALAFARRFAPRVTRDATWHSLLKDGIRGGTIREIMSILADMAERPILLEPSRHDLRDRIDLWFVPSMLKRRRRGKRWLCGTIRLLKRTTGLELTPGLNLAIRKAGSP